MRVPRSSLLRCCTKALAPALACAVVAACSDDDPGPGTVVNPNLPAIDAGDAAGAGATFTQIYTTVLAPRCAPCHTQPQDLGITQGALDMTSQAAAYASLVNVAAAGTACAGFGTRVVPFQPNNSLLFLKVSPDVTTPCGSKMPLTAAALSRQETDLIVSWIEAGALDN